MFEISARKRWFKMLVILATEIPDDPYFATVIVDYVQKEVSLQFERSSILLVSTLLYLTSFCIVVIAIA